MRVHGLAALQHGLKEESTAVGRVQGVLPAGLLGPLRRLFSPLRIAPLSFDADVPVESQFRASACAKLPRSVSILIPVHGNAALTLRCLRSVVAHTPPDTEIVVVDDASPGDTHAQLYPFTRAHGICLQRNMENLGFPRTVNIAARQSHGDLLLVLNSDVVVTPGWLNALYAAWALEPCPGLVGPLGSDTGDVATFPASYASVSELNQFASTLRSRGVRKVEKLSLFCALMERSVFEQVGGIDERYDRGLFDDDDLCMALLTRGRSVLLCENVFVHHSAGSSFRRLSALEYLARFEVNRARFESKWSVRWRPHAAF